MVQLRHGWTLAATLVALTLPSAAYTDDHHATDPANFSGHWTGSGQFTQRNSFFGSTTGPCAVVDVTIEHLPTQLTIQHYHAVCGSLNSDWGPHVMEIRDGKIFEDNEETGTFDGDILKALERSGAVQYAFNLRLEPARTLAAPQLETYYGVKNAAGSMVIEGNLNAAP